MEVIFVDDGSNDNTLSIIQSYQTKLEMQVKTFHHEWRGLGATRNVVVNNTSGEYIVWVDGDMRLSEDFVKKQIEYMESNVASGIGKGRYSISVQPSLVSELENIEFVTTNFRRKAGINSTPLGAGGAIYRVEAIRQVGGFDEDITGSGEDMDAEHRINRAGWSLGITSAVFCEIRRKTWNSLWNEYLWHGRGGAYLFKKRKQTVTPHKLFPPIAFGVELSRAAGAFRITRRKVALLLPLHYIFKRAAWLLGFLRGFLGKNADS